MWFSAGPSGPSTSLSCVPLTPPFLLQFIKYTGGASLLISWISWPYIVRFFKVVGEGGCALSWCLHRCCIASVPCGAARGASSHGRRVNGGKRVSSDLQLVKIATQQPCDRLHRKSEPECRGPQMDAITDISLHNARWKRPQRWLKTSYGIQCQAGEEPSMFLSGIPTLTFITYFSMNPWSDSEQTQTPSFILTGLQLQMKTSRHSPNAQLLMNKLWIFKRFFISSIITMQHYWLDKANQRMCWDRAESVFCRAWISPRPPALTSLWTQLTGAKTHDSSAAIDSVLPPFLSSFIPPLTSFAPLLHSEA